MKKIAFVEALPTLTGLATGYGPGRSVAGETAAALAPEGRIHRSENIARNAAVIGAPLGGLVAMGLARKHNLVPRLQSLVGSRFPRGLIAEPAVEQELVNLGIPGVAAITGSLAGGAVTGGAVGAAQQLRGPTYRKEAALKPSPMWGTIGGQAHLPAWRAQAGFTPTGMSTPSQKLQKSMNMGKFNPSKGLKPLDLGKMQQVTEKSAADKSEEKRPHQGLRALGGLGLEAGANAGTLLAGKHMLSSLAAEGKLPGQSDLMSKVKSESTTPVHEVPYYGGASYIPKNEGGATYHHKVHGIKENPREPQIIIDKSFKAPSILSHEIGHSEIDKSRLGRLLQHPVYNKMISGNARPLVALGLGAATGGSDDERVRNAGIAGAGLLSAPNLISEGMANVKGYQRLKRLGANPEQLSAARKTLIPAMGTYAGRSIATMGTALLGSSIAGAVANAKRKHDAETTKMGSVMVSIMKIADDGGHGGFSVSQYSGVMNPPRLPYASGIPSFSEPPVKTAGPPSEKKANILRDDPEVQALNDKWDRRATIGGITGSLLGAGAGHALTRLPNKGVPLGRVSTPIKGALMGGLFGIGVGGLTIENERQQAIHNALNRHVDRARQSASTLNGVREDLQQKYGAALTPASRLNSSRAIGAPRATAAPGPSIAQIAKPVGFGKPLAGACKGNNTV